VRWRKVVEVKDAKELQHLLHKMFGTDWALHSWSAGSDDRIVVVFERVRVEKK
jgi:hypothetical protein